MLGPEAVVGTVLVGVTPGLGELAPLVRLPGQGPFGGRDARLVGVLPVEGVVVMGDAGDGSKGPSPSLASSTWVRRSTMSVTP